MKTLLEHKPRGTAGFPFSLFRCKKEQAGIRTAHTHYHNDIEILQVLEGKMELTIGNEQIIAEPGRLYFINPEEIHSLYTASSPAAYRCFIFGKELLNLPADNRITTTLLDPIFERKLQFPRQSCDPALPPLLEEIDQAHRQGKNEILIFSDLLKILALTAPTLRTADGKKIIDPLRSAIRFMEEHFNEKISLSEIAEQAGFNSQYFCSYFKKHTRSTPIEYLTSLRIRHAKELLRKTNLSILEIAMQSGFENVSFFIQKFKKATGQTPGQYRRER